MAKQLVAFSVTLCDASYVREHVEMVREMRELAERIDGFVRWRDHNDGLTHWGFVVFDSDAAAQQWRGDAAHVAIHQQGEEAVYDEFHTEVFELVRENHWYRSQAGAAPDASAGNR